MNLSQYRLAALICSVLLTGCASVLNGDSQYLTLQVTCKGRDFRTYCTASNQLGTWGFRTPETKVIKRDSSPLKITCSSPTIGTYSASQRADINPVTLGNVMVGGIVGAVVDGSNNSFWQYQEVISLESKLCSMLPN